MHTIESRFNATFAHWKISLPPADVASGKRGKITEGGWAIWYLFASDERGDYLDYYASHRMTSDRHVRIYANGHEESLPTIREFRLSSNDPEEERRLEEEYFAENERIAQLLKEKGFGISGEEPGGVLMNRQLRVKKHG